MKLVTERADAPGLELQAWREQREIVSDGAVADGNRDIEVADGSAG